MSSTTALTFREGEQRYGLSLAPHTSLAPGAGTWSTFADFPILVGWLPAGTPAIRITPPSATEKEHEAKLVFHPSPADTEQKGWLKVAESAFAFWDNPDDDGWDQL